jgi:hypothetical protein
MAQRDEYVRRFYGKSRDQQEDEIHDLLKYSINHVDEPSAWRTKVKDSHNYSVIGTSGDETDSTKTEDTTTDSVRVETESDGTTKKDDWNNGDNVLGPDELPDIDSDDDSGSGSGSGTGEGTGGN